MNDQGLRTRAIVCFIEDNKHLIQQLLALRQSWPSLMNGAPPIPRRQRRSKAMCSRR
jgi:hypothetical protein